jgi:hypothetical protein
MFLKFFYNFKNKHGILSQKFAAGVTKLLPPDEIRRFDGTVYFKFVYLQNRLFCLSVWLFYYILLDWSQYLIRIAI